MSLKLKFKQFMAKLVFGELPPDRVVFGDQLQSDILSSLELTAHPDFSELLTLKNLAGDDTGYVKVFCNLDLERVSMLSINVAPGMRYINFHIIPKPTINLPRFNMEGMLTSKGSQLSIDLYSDLDPILDFDRLMERYQGLEKHYDKARNNKNIKWQASRLAHMRTFSSPYFLLAYGISAESLTTIQCAANDYFQHWLKLYHNIEVRDEPDSDGVIKRREKITQTMVDADPDRDMIVSTYGNTITEAIEAAMMA